MINNFDRPVTTTAAVAHRSGSLLASLLVGTLGLAVVMPGLVLQGVATRTRPSEADLDERDPVAASNGSEPPAAPLPNDAGSHGAGAPNGRVAQQETVDRDGGAESGHRPRRVSEKPLVRGGRKSSDRPRGTASSTDNQPPSIPAESSDPAVSQQVAGQPSVVSAVAKQPGEPTTALATVAPSNVAKSGEPGQPDDEPGLPAAVTFGDVQAAHAEAARAFRDVRNSLNEAYTIIGRLNVERYQAQYELAELKGLPLPERPPDRSWNAALKPTAPAAARRLQRNKAEPEEEEEEIDEDAVKTLARRRQIVVLAALGLLGIFALAYWISDWHWFPNLTDRAAMTQIAGIGVFMQVFFLIFFLFRLGTLTGKGKSWLFPTPEQETFKRRRKRLRGH